MMLERMVALIVGAMTAGLIGLAGVPANAGLIGPDCNTCNGGVYELTSDGVDIGNSITQDTFRITLTVSNVENIITTLGGLNAYPSNPPFYIDSLAIKVANDTISATLFDAPDASGAQGGQAAWTIVQGGINNGGCQANANNGFECADFIVTAGNFGALLTVGNDMSWTFDVTMNSGAFFGIEGIDASIKATFIQVETKGGIPSADRVGDILSENIKIQNPTTVPEPTPLAVIGAALLAMGGWHAFKRRRPRMTLAYG